MQHRNGTRAHARRPATSRAGEVTRFDRYPFEAVHRIGLDIVDGDSGVTEALWTHCYAPHKIGRDTNHHGAAQPSCLILPVSAAGGSG